MAGLGDFIDKQFSTGKLPIVGLTCVFTLDMLQFWAVHGISDFTNQILFAHLLTFNVQSLNPLVVYWHVANEMITRIIGYVLIVFVFIAARYIHYRIEDPQYRIFTSNKSCPVVSKWFELDWFVMGIMVTILPLSLVNIGVWATSTVTLAILIAVIPAIFNFDQKQRLGAAGLAGLAFVYFQAGEFIHNLLPFIPTPTSLWPSVIGLTLTQPQVHALMSIFNSVAFGPILAAILGVFFVRLNATNAFQKTPVLNEGVQEVVPVQVVIQSAGVGTLAFLGIQWLLTGQLILIPHV